MLQILALGMRVQSSWRRHRAIVTLITKSHLSPGRLHTRRSSSSLRFNAWLQALKAYRVAAVEGFQGKWCLNSSAGGRSYGGERGVLLPAAITLFLPRSCNLSPEETTCRPISKPGAHHRGRQQAETHFNLLSSCCFKALNMDSTCFPRDESRRRF